MNPSDLVRELAYPVRATACLLAGVTFTGLVWLGLHAGLAGLWLLVIVVPALFRYAVMVAEARAGDADVAPPGIEFFTLGGNAWTLFGVLPVAGLAVASVHLWSAHGIAAVGVAIAGAALLPAIIGVLVITHSPLQAIHPLAIARFVQATGAAGLGTAGLLVLLALAAGFVRQVVPALGLPAIVYAILAGHAVVGALVRHADLAHEIDLPEDESVGLARARAELERERGVVLNHAYALFSRDNRGGGLAHLDAWLREEPDGRAAREWFLARMLEWQEPLPALWFGQQYLGWLLRQGETVPAVKLMLRLTRLDDRFRPADVDRGAAVAAARATGNGDLAARFSGPDG